MLKFQNSTSFNFKMLVFLSVLLILVYSLPGLSGIGNKIMPFQFPGSGLEHTNTNSSPVFPAESFVIPLSGPHGILQHANKTSFAFPAKIEKCRYPGIQQTIKDFLLIERDDALFPGLGCIKTIRLRI
jgi:hypothetical protein